MRLPFTVQEFFSVFERYNRAIWPVQWAAIALCLLLASMTFTRKGLPGGWAFGGLAALWLLNGIAYHFMFFAAVNPAANLFGAIFLLQSALLLWAAARGGTDRFRTRGDTSAALGMAMIFYAAAVYPWLGFAAGHGYPLAPVLGVSPCPTTIFTLGILLTGGSAVPRHLFAVPILWSFTGTFAALSLGVPEDFGLGLSGLIALAVLIFRPFWHSAPRLSH